MRYDWSKAPEDAIAAVRGEDGRGMWVAAVCLSRWWLGSDADMDPSAILDYSCDWRDSLELRPVEPTP
jgi:hypothetical protein